MYFRVTAAEDLRDVREYLFWQLWDWVRRRLPRWRFHHLFAHAVQFSKQVGAELLRLVNEYWDARQDVLYRLFESHHFKDVFQIVEESFKLSLRVLYVTLFPAQFSQAINELLLGCKHVKLATTFAFFIVVVRIGDFLLVRCVFSLLHFASTAFNEFVFFFG